MISAVSILRQLRKIKEEKIKHFKTVMYFLTGLLLIDFIAIFVAKSGFWGVVGVFIIIGWLTFTFVSLIEAQKEIDNIDEFYLGFGNENENEKEETEQR